jgi:hypothetical protein
MTRILFDALAAMKGIPKYEVCCTSAEWRSSGCWLKLRIACSVTEIADKNLHGLFVNIVRAYPWHVRMIKNDQYTRHR